MGWSGEVIQRPRGPAGCLLPARCWLRAGKAEVQGRGARETQPQGRGIQFECVSGQKGALIGVKKETKVKEKVIYRAGKKQ